MKLPLIKKSFLCSYCQSDLVHSRNYKYMENCYREMRRGNSRNVRGLHVVSHEGCSSDVARFFKKVRVGTGVSAEVTHPASVCTPRINKGSCTFRPS